jgi:hypothetical protein
MTTEQKAFQEKFKRSVEMLVEQRNLHNEEFTKQMVADLIEQMLKSGDIREVCTYDGKSKTIIYLPYAGQDEWRSRAEKLERQLDQFVTAARDLHCVMEEIEGPVHNDF